MDREQLIEWLTTNCDCWSEEGSSEILANFDDQRLVNFYQASVKSKQFEPIVNAAQQSFKAVYDKDPTVNDLIQFVGNGEDCSEDNLKGDPYDFEDEDEITPKVKKPKAKPTMNEWIASAPAEYQEIITNALKDQAEKKNKLIRKLTANLRNPQQKAQLTKMYSGMKLDQLQLVANSLNPNLVRSRPTVNREYDDLDDILPNYSGAAAPAPTANYGSEGSDDDLLVPPTINFAEIAQANGRSGHKS